MKKYISVDKEGMAKLQKAFRIDGEPIGERCVKNALAYRTDNELARKIRFTALKHYGGQVYCVSAISECFYDSDSCMRNVCVSGAEVYLDKQTGVGTVYDPKGNIAARYEDVRLSQISEMQRIANSF